MLREIPKIEHLPLDPDGLIKRRHEEVLSQRTMYLNALDALHQEVDHFQKTCPHEEKSESWCGGVIEESDGNVYFTGFCCLKCKTFFPTTKEERVARPPRPMK